MDVPLSWAFLWNLYRINTTFSRAYLIFCLFVISNWHKAVVECMHQTLKFCFQGLDLINFDILKSWLSVI